MKGLSELGRLKNKIKQSFLKIKDELDDHRESINHNTNEIQANYEYMCNLDTKLDKLTERIDELSLFIGASEPEMKYNISALTSREKEVLVAIYSEDSTTYLEIMRKTGLTENLVLCYVSNLVQKGVPVIKKYLDGVVVLSLEPQFKEQQIRHNIVGVSETVSRSLNA